MIRQDPPVDYWLVADELDRDSILQDRFGPYKNPSAPTVTIGHIPKKPGNRGNLAACCNWALDQAEDLQVDLLVFLQDFIWMPPDGVQRFLNAAVDHPFALLTGVCHPAKAPVDTKRVPFKDRAWNIFSEEHMAFDVPEKLEDEPRVTMGVKPGRISNHAWEVNYGALPYALINRGIRFDEDYDIGTQWENTQFSFDVARSFPNHDGGYVWWDGDNVSYSLPHREFFPETHKDERSYDNGELFWSKNRDLVGRL